MKRKTIYFYSVLLNKLVQPQKKKAKTLLFIKTNFNNISFTTKKKPYVDFINN